MINFPCPSCGRNYSVKDEYAGKRTKCPKCGQKIRVPTVGQLITPRMQALESFDDIPPPVLDATKSGREVWELREWETGLEAQALHMSAYIVLDNKTLNQAFWKEHHSKGSIFGAKNREVIKWGESKLDDVKE